MGTEGGSFKCTQCQLNRHKCFLCKKFGDESVVKVEGGCAPSMPDLYVSVQCITSSPFWPQARVTAALVCSDYNCAIENTRDPVMKYIKKQMHCVKCPPVYHFREYCLSSFHTPDGKIYCVDCIYGRMPL
jgi:hypothetical protein